LKLPAVGSDVPKNKKPYSVAGTMHAAAINSPLRRLFMWSAGDTSYISNKTVQKKENIAARCSKECPKE
jgi:hypothetical protein